MQWFEIISLIFQSESKAWGQASFEDPEASGRNPPKGGRGAPPLRRVPWDQKKTPVKTNLPKKGVKNFRSDPQEPEVTPAPPRPGDHLGGSPTFKRSLLGTRRNTKIGMVTHQRLIAVHHIALRCAGQGQGMKG